METSEVSLSTNSSLPSNSIFFTIMRQKLVMSLLSIIIFIFLIASSFYIFCGFLSFVIHLLPLSPMVVLNSTTLTEPIDRLMNHQQLSTIIVSVRESIGTNDYLTYGCRCHNPVNHMDRVCPPFLCPCGHQSKIIVTNYLYLLSCLQGEEDKRGNFVVSSPKYSREYYLLSY